MRSELRGRRVIYYALSAIYYAHGIQTPTTAVTERRDKGYIKSWLIFYG